MGDDYHLGRPWTVPQGRSCSDLADRRVGKGRNVLIRGLLRVGVVGLVATFRLLAETDTEAASRVLAAALASSEVKIQEAALVATLKRRDTTGQREILRRWDLLDDRWRGVVKQHRDRMTRVMRDSLLATDTSLCTSSCNAAVWLQLYEIIPTLLSVMVDPLNPHGDLIASTLLRLAEQLYNDLATPSGEESRRNPQAMRQHVIASMEIPVQRFARHRRREVVEAFLMLVERDNVVLKQILQEAHHASFPVLVEMMTKSTWTGVIRLLLNFLDDPNAPTAALQVVGNRCDAAFLRYLLRKIGREASTVVKQNLKRVTSFAWMRTAADHISQWDDAGQHAAIRLVMASGVSRPQVFSVVEYILHHGKPGGRRAAAEALAEISGTEANNAALAALSDSDPNVQATIVLQLRRRGIPGILSRLVELLESPHSIVRQAARKSLSEFSFKRFLGAFDMLDDDVRRNTGLLVRKADPQTIPLLTAELRSKMRTRRLRGLAIVRTLDVVDALEPAVLQLLQDEDHMIRIEAVNALGASNSDDSRAALEEALNDRSPAVQDAAQKCLSARNVYATWRGELADPRD